MKTFQQFQEQSKISQALDFLGKSQKVKVAPTDVTDLKNTGGRDFLSKKFGVKNAGEVADKFSDLIGKSSANLPKTSALNLDKLFGRVPKLTKNITNNIKTISNSKTPTANT